MQSIDRKEFIRESVVMSGGLLVTPAYVRNMISDSPNERINVALIGIAGKRPSVRGIINGRGIVHINNYAEIPNVRISTLCDADERLFPEKIKIIEEKFGATPKTEFDFRKVLEDKEIDVISIATPDHWHALMTIWACQAGKDVYVEKPVCHNLSEGRKMVEAARKYNRMVQAGICYRDSKAVKEGIQFVHDGKLGKVYMAKGVTYRYRDTIGKVADSPVPEGLHWDLFLGPAPLRPYNENRFLYNWHFFWDTGGTTEFGNNGIYRMDTVRWALNKNEHPVKINCTGGKYCRDDDQEVPNILMADYEYSDGVILQNEARCLATNQEGFGGSADVFVYSDQGWMTFSPDGYKTYFGKKSEPGPARSDKDFPANELHNGWKNLIDCVRSRRREDLDNDILEGHMSAALGHLGVISFRTGRKLAFNSETEKFVNDPEADKLLTRKYREPFVIPNPI
ncbi:MAG TPA: Gfo/Idh/MocA family oxidoreductase [Prolixibacteraceae bacterium]|nr:Gfo/Idh/MocA family oxidoreductase [Prolixibacteraceae bacterium]